MARRLVLAAVVLLAAGCGESEEKKLRDTIHRLANAVADADARTVCSLMTDRYKNTLAGPCEKSLNYDTHPLSTDEKQALRRLEITRLTIRGDTADVTLQERARDPASVRFKRVDGRWLLDDEGGASGD